ncbi:hypothetical protein K458DRAFT_320844, partial [Lentithecium fluviatile CBS 122367]
INNNIRGLRYIKLNIRSLRLIIFTNFLFTNNKNLSSYIRYIVVIVDNASRLNLIN